ncbi:MAG: DNA-directed RNA polymerase subunit omega [Bdellovibrionales bacterium]|nr:DNA-directed RNA polymerase subunit omega [Bdellovibrionales bacterium]
MARITVEDCLDKVPNRFALVMLVAKRAKGLLKGATATIHAKNNKQVVTALREVAEGMVLFRHDESHGTPNEQIQADLNR